MRFPFAEAVWAEIGRHFELLPKACSRNARLQGSLSLGVGRPLASSTPSFENQARNCCPGFAAKYSAPREFGPAGSIFSTAYLAAVKASVSDAYWPFLRKAS